MLPQKVVLLACGSYNPITNMHLRMFELAKDSLQKTGRYKVVGGVISPVNDKYGKKELVSASHRCAMLRLALKTSDWIRMDTWEAEQTKWNETAAVLKHHKSVLQTNHNLSLTTDSPKNNSKKKRRTTHKSSPRKGQDSQDYTITNISEPEGPPQIRLLCGADLLESFAVPNLWKPEDIIDIVSNYGLVCITRNGSNPQKFIYESDVLSKYENNIHIVTEWITNDISSTKIRRALRRQESIKYLVQESVVDYIHKHKLYQPADNKLINHMVISPEKEVPSVANVPDIEYLSPPGCLPVPTETEFNRSPSSGYGSGYDLSPNMHPIDVYEAEQQAMREHSDYENIDSSMETSMVADNAVVSTVSMTVPSLKKNKATNTSPAGKTPLNFDRSAKFEFEGKQAFGRACSGPESPKILHDALNRLESGKSVENLFLLGSPRKKGASNCPDGSISNGNMVNPSGTVNLNNSVRHSNRVCDSETDGWSRMDNCLINLSDGSPLNNHRQISNRNCISEPTQSYRHYDPFKSGHRNAFTTYSQSLPSSALCSPYKDKHDSLNMQKACSNSSKNHSLNTFNNDELTMTLTHQKGNQGMLRQNNLDSHLSNGMVRPHEGHGDNEHHNSSGHQSSVNFPYTNVESCPSTPLVLSSLSSPRSSIPGSDTSSSTDSKNNGCPSREDKTKSKSISEILRSVRNIRLGPCLPSETCV